MGGLEVMVTVLALTNGFIVLVRPIGRLHARLDVLEERLGHVARTVDRIAAPPGRD